MTQGSATSMRVQPWGLWFIQARRLIRIELRRNLFSRRAAWIYFLAFIPTFVLLIHSLHRPEHDDSISENTKVLAAIVQLYYVRLGIYFGCLGIFSRLIRGEMMERSLHFFLLSPVRREVLLLSKFVAGSITALLLFLTATLLDIALMYFPFNSASREYFSQGPGLEQMGLFLLIVVLACLGYGAVFLLLSMVFKNPTPGALLFLGWEVINPLLPSLLQKFSVASYLRQLMPVDIGTRGLIALLTVETEPVPGWVATAGLLLLILLVLTYSCYRMRTLEIRYTTE